MSSVFTLSMEPRDYAAVLPDFAVCAVQNPEGMKPGRYYYVVLLRLDRKVSRYCRRAETAHFKRRQYERRWVKGERYWPAVGRLVELRQSRYVVPTASERYFLSVLTFGLRFGTMPYRCGVRVPR